MNALRKGYPHAIAIAGFIIVSLIYFYPVLQGKKIFQSDIAQYTGMARERDNFRASSHTESYWTDAAFGGMPTYQLGAEYPHNYIKSLDNLIRFLPRPADYLMLYFLGFYILLLTLKAPPLKAFFGALAFGLSTYLVVILGIGHNAKAHAIAYMPLVIAGVIMVFRRRFVMGGLLTMIAAALEINANHFQMTYYLLILLVIISIFYIVRLAREKDYRSIGIAAGIFALAGIMAIGVNATNIMATSEYAKFSTRDKSELTFNPDGSKKESNNAMTHEYITEYSYGIGESLDLIYPRLFGGSNGENVGTDSKMYEFMLSQGVPEAQAAQFTSGMPTYWGDQPIVAAPAYIGAIVFFLAVLAFLFDRRKLKYAFLAGAAISLLLSWGKNFPSLTDLFIDHIPMYNKFRAVSSIQVLLELCLPALAIMGLQAFFTLDKPTQLKAIWQTALVGLGLTAFLFIFKNAFGFTGGTDSYYAQSYGPAFVEALKADRRSLYMADLLRSGFFMLVTALLLWLAMKESLKQQTAIILIGILMAADLFFIDKNYVGAKDFVSAAEIEQPFEATQADAAIMQDTTHYRVFEVAGNMASGRASFFHQSLGGYHAAKPRRMQQLFDYQIAKNNVEVLDMLNVKYIIQTDSTGASFPTKNPDANGNAWFVKNIAAVNSADAEMKALDHFKSDETAVVNTTEFASAIKARTFSKDSVAAINLVSYKPNALKYISSNPNPGLAVFSEVYYPHGWNAFIDGKNAGYFRADYDLRAMYLPAGKHVIEFKFEPELIKTGGTITLASAIGIFFLMASGLYYERRKLWFAEKH